MDFPNLERERGEFEDLKLLGLKLEEGAPKPRRAGSREAQRQLGSPHLADRSQLQGSWHTEPFNWGPCPGEVMLESPQKGRQESASKYPGGLNGTSQEKSPKRQGRPSKALLRETFI